MPELPEVETFRRQLERSFSGKRIENVRVIPDKVVIAGPPSHLKKALLKARIQAVCRRGKYIWFELDHRPWPVFHLGMTGSYLITKELPRELKSVKLILEMENGGHLLFKDPRRFGRIFLFDDPLNEKPLSDLGPDALDDLPPPAKLYDGLQKRSAPIKAVLLDQSVLSGIGNWTADEILFQSGISPMRPASSLHPDEVKTLQNKIKSVLKLAVNVEAHDEEYPEEWIFHHRWGKKGEQVASGEEIRFDTVGGRTTA